MANWIQNCQICNDGLCIRMEGLKKEGHSERASAEIMQEEALEFHPEMKDEFAAERIRRRYNYHWKEKGKRGVVQIVPAWPMCKTCGEYPVKESSFHNPAEPAEHSLCSHCHWKGQQDQRPNCRECGGNIRGEIYSHGLCEICRKKELREAKSEDANKRLDERQKEIDQTPVDAEVNKSWLTLISQFEAVLFGDIFVDTVYGKVEEETVAKIKEFKNELSNLMGCLDEVIDRSEASVRVQ